MAIAVTIGPAGLVVCGSRPAAGLSAVAAARDPTITCDSRLGLRLLVVTCQGRNTLVSFDLEAECLLGQVKQLPSLLDDGLRIGHRSGDFSVEIDRKAGRVVVSAQLTAQADVNA